MVRTGETGNTRCEAGLSLSPYERRWHLSRHSHRGPMRLGANPPKNRMPPWLSWCQPRSRKSRPPRPCVGSRRHRGRHDRRLGGLYSSTMLLSGSAGRGRRHDAGWPPAGRRHRRRRSLVELGLQLHGRTVMGVREGEGKPVLLLHSAGSTSMSWSLSLGVLSQSFTAVAPDLPGFGASDPLPSPWSVRAFADFVWELLDSLEMPRAHLAGNSFGALIALQMAAQQPFADRPPDPDRAAVHRRDACRKTDPPAALAADP